MPARTDIWLPHTGAEWQLARRGQALWARRRQILSRPDGMTRFLAHACRHVPRYRSLGHGTRGALELGDFPVVTRAEVSSAVSDFVSTGAVRAPRCIYAKTSGATGSPLTILLDLAAWYELNYETYATIARIVPGLTELLRPGRPGIVLVSNERNRAPCAIALPSLRGALFRRHLIGAEGEGADQRLVHDLRRDAIPLLYGKSTYLLDLAHRDENTRPAGRIRPHAILVSGENLFDAARARLESWFGCRVYNAYTCAEGGLVALDCPSGRGLHVAGTRVRVEVRRVDGTVRVDGEGEIVLTNLCNWAMTFIRYRTGDNATLGMADCRCGYRGPTLLALPAREARAFETPSGTIPTAALDAVFSDIGIEQFEVIQAGPSRFHVKWGGQPSLPAAKVTRTLRNRLEGLLRPVELTVDSVERVIKPGGKAHRYVIASPNGKQPRYDSWTHARLRLAHAQAAARRSPARAAAIPNIRAVAISPDSRRLATSWTDGVIRIWSLHTRELMQTFRCGAQVTVLEFAPIGHLLACGCADGTLRVLDLEAATWMAASVHGADAIRALAVAPDGQLIAAASPRGGVTLWTVMAGRSGELKKIAMLPSNARPQAIAFSPDAESFAVAAGDAVLLLDMATGRLLGRVLVPRSRVTALAYSPNSKLLAIGSDRGRLAIWRLASAERERTLAGDRGAICAVAFTPESEYVVSGHAHGAVRICRATDGVTVSAIETSGTVLRSLAVARDAMFIASGSTGRASTCLELWGATWEGPHQ